MAGEGYAQDSNFSYLACAASLMLLFLGIIVSAVPELQALPCFGTHEQKQQQRNKRTAAVA